MTVHIIGAPEAWQERLQTVTHCALEALHMAHDAVQLSLVLTDETAFRQYYRRFRGQDKVSDVLAFPIRERLPDEEAVYLGDIVICLPVARQQAERAGHALEEEICLLVIHGILHLLGYDDEDPDQRNIMWAKQRQLMERCGCEISEEP